MLDCRVLVLRFRVFGVSFSSVLSVSFSSFGASFSSLFSVFMEMTSYLTLITLIVICSCFLPNSYHLIVLVIIVTSGFSFFNSVEKIFSKPCLVFRDVVH